MTESEAIKEIETSLELAEMCTPNKEREKEIKAYKIAIQALKEIREYREIGSVEEFKALKDKNTPVELAEHNFQDEVHHYLCPSCRNIVSCNQNYCEECGQALEN